MSLFYVAKHYYIKNTSCYIDTADEFYKKGDYQRFSTYRNLEEKHQYLFCYTGFSKQVSSSDVFVFKQEFEWRGTTQSIHVALKTIPSLYCTVQDFEKEGVSYVAYKVDEYNEDLIWNCDFREYRESEQYSQLYQGVRNKLEDIRDLINSTLEKIEPENYYGPGFCSYNDINSNLHTGNKRLVPLIQRGKTYLEKDYLFLNYMGFENPNFKEDFSTVLIKCYSEYPALVIREQEDLERTGLELVVNSDPTGYTSDVTSVDIDEESVGSLYAGTEFEPQQVTSANKEEFDQIAEEFRNNIRISQLDTDSVTFTHKSDY